MIVSVGKIYIKKKCLAREFRTLIKLSHTYHKLYNNSEYVTNEWRFQCSSFISIYQRTSTIVSTVLRNGFADYNKKYICEFRRKNLRRYCIKSVCLL